MDYLSILGLLGIMGFLIWCVVYAGFVVLILVPLAIFVYLKNQREKTESKEILKSRAEEFVQKYKGHTVEYYYLSGTCMVDYNKRIRTKLLGMDKEYFLLENSHKLPFTEYIHPVD